MKQTRKRIGSLLIAVCMVLTMLPTVAFAEEGVPDSGVPSSAREITAFADLAEEVALQEVETGTTLDELNLPSTLTVTVTTGAAMTSTVSGDDVATDSEAQETEAQEEITIEVPNWVADPDYDGDTEGDYTFTPTLDLPDDTTLAEGVTLPQIKVTVKTADAPMLLGAEIQPLGTGTDITADFTDATFLAEVRTALGKAVDDPIYDTDNFASVKTLKMYNKGITSLAGIEHFTALTRLECPNNQLTELDVSKNIKLTKLYCHNNKLTELDVSSNMELTELACSDNPLTELDVSKNTKLIWLYCDNNQLTALEVSGNTKLTRLYCKKNQLTELDVSKNINLTELNCYNNQLTELDVSENTKLTSLIYSDNKLTKLDGSNNTELTGLSCSNNPLKTLDVSKNTKLIVLDCVNNQLTVLDVSSNTALSRLDCSENQLTALDWSNNTELTELNCSTNQLTGLNVSRNTKLTKLNCYTNQLTGLDVTSNTKLTELDCSDNYMPNKSAIKGLNTNLTTNLTFDPQNSPGNDITANFKDANFLAEVRIALTKDETAPIYDTDAFASVKTLSIENKSIKSLAGIENFTALTELNCKNNKLTALDVSKNTELKNLDCSTNQLTGLDVTSNKKLIELNCSDNYMLNKSAVKGLDTSLTTIFTFDPQNSGTPMGDDITAMFKDANFLAEVRIALHKDETASIYDKDDFASVETLSIDNKDIKSLAGIEYFTELTELNCLDNQLSELDLSKNTALTTLICAGNGLTQLDVSKNMALMHLICDSNQLIQLDVSKNTALMHLRCSSNKLTTLDVSKNTELVELHCYSNKLTTLDVTSNTKLTELNCSDNYMLEESAVKGLNTSLTTTFTFAPQNSGTPIGNDITAIFKDATFLAEVRKKLGKTATDPIYDTDNFASITSLNVSNKSIKSLAGIEYFTALTSLICFTNQLTTLDVSKNTKLNTLRCDGNQLTKLDVGSNVELTFLRCDGNQLATLDVSKNTKLITLICDGNKLTVLDVRSNTALDSLYCDSNKLTMLDVSQNTKLKWLFCLKNQLTQLDVRSNTALENLDCSYNKLIKLDVSQNTKLTMLNCSHNYMPKESAVEGLNTSLTETFTFAPQNPGKPIGNDITAIFKDATFLAEVRKKLGKTATAPIYDTDNFASVTSLLISRKSITSLAGIEYFTALTKLDCSDNQLSELEVSKNTKLTELDCNGIQLSELDVRKNTELTHLSCFSNNLTTLDVRSNTKLTELNCNNNQLNGLDISKNTVLNMLGCINNQLTELDVSNNTALTRLGCADNQLKTLDVSKNTKLITLYCVNNQLTELDVSKNIALTELDCSENYMPNKLAVKGLDTSLTTKFTFDPQNSSLSTYAVTVNSGTASLSTAAAGAAVTITADSASSGQRFKEWTVVGGGVTLTDPQAASTTFTMPANAVEVTATYEDIPAGVTPVTGVTLNKTALSLYSNTSTKTANLTATITPADATDKSVTWQSSNTAVVTVDASGKVAAVGNGTANITVTTTDGGYTARCTVTVSTYTSGGGSSSGGGSGGGSSSGDTSTKITITKEKQPNQPITAVASVTATAGTNGTASASISDKAVTDAIAKAQTELKKQGKTANGIAVGLNVTMPKGATTLTATLPQNGLNSLVSAGVTNLEINGAPITLTFDQKVLTEIQKQSSGNVNIAIAPQGELSKMAKALIGTRPVYNITVGYGDNRTVSNFGSGVATVGIPYTPANGEAIGGLYAVYVDENGNATRVAGSAYDANSGCIIFTTTHFSMYGVGYIAPSAEFADISNHWAKESIDYVVGRGLLSGTSETTFAPNTAMTRGMLVTALGRLEGVDVSSYTKNSFTDVKSGSAFKPYIEWAYEKGIIQGIGNNKFAPDRAITREEIAVIVTNFTKATGYTLPVKSEATTYADDSSISSTYKTAVTAMQQAGIMMGGTSNKFNPKSNATRAEVSSMLYRYMKLNME